MDGESRGDECGPGDAAVIVPTARVGDLAEQVRGVTYGKEDASRTPTAGCLPVLRAGNITDNGLIFDDLIYVPAAKVSAKQKIKLGDIVIAASSGSLDVVGKAAPALAAFDGGFGAFCKVIRPNDKVDAGYLAQFFKTPSYRRTISSLAAGANINNLKSEHLDDLLLPLPPLPEQRRIAAILDQADALRAKRREALAQLDNLTQSIFIEMFGDPRENDRGWSKASIGSLVSDMRGGASLEPDDFIETGFPVLHKGAIKPNGGLAFDPKKRPFTAVEYAAARPQNRINRDFIAVTLRDLVPSGPSIGLAADLRFGPFDEYLLAQGAYGFRVASERLTEAFLVQLSNMPTFRLVLRQNAVGSTQIHIRTPIYLAIEIPVPPMGLQQTFATRVQAVEALKTTHRAALTELDALFASLQHRAFSGQLS